MGADLVTKAEYKAYAGIASDTQDAIITSIIPKVSQLIKSLCRRTFLDHVNESKIEVYSGGHGNKLYLKEYPLLSVIAVEKSVDYGAIYTELVEFTDYAIDQEDGSIVAINADFTKYINGYKITYTGGYENLPDDLKIAVMDLVTYYIKSDSSIHSTKSPGSNSVQIEYITTTNLPAHIKRVLDLYTSSFD